MSKRKHPKAVPLTDREQRFVDEFIVTHNATDAAKKSGFGNASYKSARAMGSKLRNQPNIMMEIARRTAEAARKADVTVVDVLVGLKELAFANMGDYLIDDKRGLPTFRKLKDLTREQLAALSEVAVIEESAPLGQTPKKTIRFKLHNKRDALVDLGRYLKMFVEAQGANGPTNITNNNTTVVVQNALSATDRLFERVIAGFALESRTPSVQDGPLLPVEVHASEA